MTLSLREWRNNMQDKYQQTYGTDFTSYAKDNNLPVGVFETKKDPSLFVN